MITVFIADDNRVFRQYLCKVLHNISYIEVIGNAENGKIAVERVRTLKPDVVLMDVRMPIMDGIEATRLITDEFPGIKVIAFTSCSEKEIIEQMLEAGASGYLPKGDGLTQIAAAINAAYYNIENINLNIHKTEEKTDCNRIKTCPQIINRSHR